MQRHRRLRLRCLQHTGLKHRFRAREAFLVGLEDELHRALELALMRLEQPCSAQQHGCVHVVSAGVHTPVCSAERQVVVFLYLKCVHIRPQKQGALPLAQRHHLAAGSDILGITAQLCQDLSDIVRSLGQFQTDFRNLVQRPSVYYHMFLHLGHALRNGLFHAFSSSCRFRHELLTFLHRYCTI